MDRTTLAQWLDAFGRLRVAVVGDFFLDKYLVIDPGLAEVSIETGLEAHQVVETRLSPGAAGTIASNLSDLGAGTVHAVTIIGEDGEGHDLTTGMSARRVSSEFVIRDRERVTPAYTKPMMRQDDGSERELSRQDVKNWTPTPPRLEQSVVDHLQQVVPEVDGVVVLDQVTARNHGVVTDAVRREIARLARGRPNTVFIGDARERIGEYRDIIVKPNGAETMQAMDADFAGVPTLTDIRRSGARLSALTGRPVCVTLGVDGILVYDDEEWGHAPTMRQDGPIDIVGAGDSVMAAVLSALCCGASLREAAVLGNIVASIVIQQLGTTGTASPEQILERYDEFERLGLISTR